MNKIYIQIVYKCIQHICVYICRYTHKSVHTVISRALLLTVWVGVPFAVTVLNCQSQNVSLGQAQQPAKQTMSIFVRARKLLNNAV